MQGSEHPEACTWLQKGTLAHLKSYTRMKRSGAQTVAFWTHWGCDLSTGPRPDLGFSDGKLNIRVLEGSNAKF